MGAREEEAIRERTRARLARLERDRAEARAEEGLPPRPVDPPPPAETLAEGLAERPARGVLLLALLPVIWPVLLWSRARGELEHESWRFRYHDFVARNPVLGLTLSLAGALGSVMAFAGAATLLYVLRPRFPWLIW